MEQKFKKGDLISIIIPAYNGGKFLEEWSIPSVLSQTYSNWEIIVVDNRSSDETPVVVAEFCKKDRRISYEKAFEKQGLAFAYNVGIRRAKGEMVAFLEQDDIWLPDKLERQISAMVQNENYIYSTSQCWLLDEATMKIFGIAPAVFSGVMMYKNVFEKIGLFDESRELLGIQDGDLQAMLNLAYKKSNPNYHLILDAPLILFTRHKGSLSARGENSSKKFIERYSAICKKYDRPEFIDNEGIRDLLGFWYTHLALNFLLIGNDKDGRICLERVMDIRPSSEIYIITILSHFPAKIAQGMFVFINELKKITGGFQAIVYRHKYKKDFHHAQEILKSIKRKK